LLIRLTWPALLAGELKANLEFQEFPFDVQRPQPGIAPPRIVIATAAIFSLIALAVSIRPGLPKVSCLTKADDLVPGCTFMVFNALGVAVIGSRWANSDRMEAALKINAVARWLYVLMFAPVARTAVSC
jgi:hypothetical protein